MAENVRYELPAALLDRYRQLVSGVSEMTAQVVWAQIQTAQPKTRRELEAIVANALRSGDSEMSEIDRQYYEAARRYITGEDSWGSGLLTDEEWAGSFDRALDAMLREYGEYDPETGWYEIREDDWARFESDLSQYVRRTLNESSKHYVEVYGSRDYRKPKYARVPSGAETCAWCWSLAGLGFQYKSAESASHSHDNCDCVITPSWDESGVEGYDSEYYANLFRDARSWLNSAEAPEELKRRVYETALAHTDGSYQSIRNFERWNGVLMAMRWRDGLK